MKFSELTELYRKNFIILLSVGMLVFFSLFVRFEVFRSATGSDFLLGNITYEITLTEVGMRNNNLGVAKTKRIKAAPEILDPYDELTIQTLSAEYIQGKINMTFYTEDREMAEDTIQQWIDGVISDPFYARFFSSYQLYDTQWQQCDEGNTDLYRIVVYAIAATYAALFSIVLKGLR